MTPGQAVPTTWNSQTPTLVPTGSSVAPPRRIKPRGPGPQIPGYVMIHEIARGGQSVVYLARQISLNRLVALKMLLGGVAADPEERARFHREACAVAKLKHPHIVQIHDVGEAYLALEFVGGGTLTRRIGGLPQPARTPRRSWRRWPAPCTGRTSKALSIAISSRALSC